MPARVKGPTDHVVIVGAGYAGLSAALRLAGAGRKVTVIERESKNPNMAWDFWSYSPEALHQITILMSNRGTP